MKKKKGFIVTTSIIVFLIISSVIGFLYLKENPTGNQQIDEPIKNIEIKLRENPTIDNTIRIIDEQINNLRYVNKEPKINNEIDALALYQADGIMPFYDPTDSDTQFFEFGDIEHYCTKGVLVENGCKYTVNYESECLPDPVAPENGVTFDSITMTCISHYIHTRVKFQCLRTGEIVDYNTVLERNRLIESCPDCNWFYSRFYERVLQQNITFDKNEYKGVELVIITPYDKETVWFCTNKMVKMGDGLNKTIAYLDKYIESNW